MDECTCLLDTSCAMLFGKAEEGLAVPVCILRQDGAFYKAANCPLGFRAYHHGTLEIVIGIQFLAPLVGKMIRRHMALLGGISILHKAALVDSYPFKAIVYLDGVHVPKYRHGLGDILIRSTVFVLFLADQDMIVRSKGDFLPVTEGIWFVRQFMHDRILILEV